jgi:CspA family cold shock protein
VLVPGYKGLTAGQDVEFTYEAADQDGYAYRAVEVWPAGQQPFRGDRFGAGTSDGAYSATFTIRTDEGDNSPS